MNNVRDFGAKGDGVTKDTAAIQKAIDAGGMVCFPPGTYLSGTIYLKSDTGLFLEPGAILKASPDKEDYNADDFCPQNRVFTIENVSGAHFIVAVEQKNVTICGNGRIDGNRQAFYGDQTQPDAGKFDGKFDRDEIRNGWRPGQMIYFCECSNVHITDVQMYNAPYWTCFLHGCEDVQIRGVHILNDQRTFNGDGLDVDCCRRVTISDCVIDSGDDCITLRGYVDPLKKPRPCEYVTVTNCVLHTNCNAIRIGVGTGIIRNAVFSNIVIHDARLGINVCSQYSSNHSVLIENVQFENMYIEAKRPFAIVSNAWGRCLGPVTQKIRNVSFRHIHAVGEVTSVFAGYDSGDLIRISVKDLTMALVPTSVELTDDPNADVCENTGVSSVGAIRFEHIDGLVASDIRVDFPTELTGWKYAVEQKDCPGAVISGIDSTKPVKEL